MPRSYMIEHDRNLLPKYAIFQYGIAFTSQSAFDHMEEEHVRMPVRAQQFHARDQDGLSTLVMSSIMRRRSGIGSIASRK